MITLIVGNLGSGKTAMLTVIGIAEIDAGKKVYATYHINYEKDGNKVMFVDVGDLMRWFRMQDTIFLPNTGSLLLDEGYLGMDSRQSQSNANLLLTNFVLQTRHFGLDLYVSAQLASSIDKRMRLLADAIILAQRSDIELDDGSTDTQFTWTYMGSDGTNGELSTNEAGIKEIGKYYSTMEIVEAPLMALDKKVMKAVKEERIEVALNRRKKMKTDLKIDLPVSANKRVSKRVHKRKRQI